LDVESVKVEKRKLEENLRMLFDKFVEETGCLITIVDVDQCGIPKPNYTIKLTVEVQEE